MGSDTSFYRKRNAAKWSITPRLIGSEILVHFHKQLANRTG